MTYTSGTVNDANPGPVLWAAMDTAILAAGLTLVDTVTIAARTHKVYKSAAASNAQNKDWYLDVGYQTAGAGTIIMQCFEFYDPATDLGYRGLFTGVSVNTIDAATSSRYGATGYALETNWLGTTGTSDYAITLIITSFQYMFSVTPDRAMLTLSSSSGYRLAYVGLYQPDALYVAKAGAAIYPLVGCTVGSSVSGTTATAGSSPSNSSAALTRVPPASVLAGNGWATHVYIGMVGLVTNGSIPGSNQITYPWVATPLFAYTAVSTPAAPAVFGQLYDLAGITTTGTWGDTITIGGNTWAMTSPFGTISSVFKAV